jgi:hypothetical protein
MWEPRRLTTLWASMACYRDSFTFFFFTFFRNVGELVDYTVRRRNPTKLAVDNYNNVPFFVPLAP